MKTEAIRYYSDGTAEYEQGIIVCNCNDHNHSIIYWKQENFLNVNNIEKEVYLGVSLMSRNTFWERLKLAFRYLFRRSKSGKPENMYTEFIISKDNVSGLEDIVNFINDEE